MNPKDFDSTDEMPAVDITLNPANNELRVYQSFSVRMPSEDEEATLVKISVLHDCRELLTKLITAKYSFSDVLLAFCGVTGGAVLNRIFAGVELALVGENVIFLVLVVLTGMSFVAHIFTRREENLVASTVAESVLKALPKTEVQEVDA